MCPSDLPNNKNSSALLAWLIRALFKEPVSGVNVTWSLMRWMIQVNSKGRGKVVTCFITLVWPSSAVSLIRISGMHVRHAATELTCLAEPTQRLVAVL